MKAPDCYEALPRPIQKVIDQILHVAMGGGSAGLVGGVASLWLADWLARGGEGLQKPTSYESRDGAF